MGIVSRTVVIFLFLITSINLKAQLCQGSLGDPIVNITFGAGSNPGTALTAATTSYQYVTKDCPDDGFYTVRNNTTNCFNNSWHSLTADHTGNANGYFMLVNASFQPSAFYIDTVKGLCSNTTFEFAAWIMNVLRTSACSGNGIQPNLTFTIEKTDGTVLQTYNSGNIPMQANPTWQQYGFFFTTPAGVTDIVLRIFNNAPGGCGNDLALDDITFRPCGPQLTPAITGSPSTTVSYCQGTAKAYTFNTTVSAGFNSPSYQWQESTDGINWTDIPMANTTTFNKSFPANTPAGNYLYRLSAAETGNLNSAKCRVVSPVLTIKVVANPVTTAAGDTPLCEGALLTLKATGGTQYQWTGVNSYSATGDVVTISNVQTVNAGKYYVLVTNADNCSHLDSVTIAINNRPVAGINITSATICSGKDVQLIASGGTSFEWKPSTGLSSSVVLNPRASPASTTQYMAIAFNAAGCTDTAYADINVIESPKANAGPDKAIIAGSPVQLSGIVGGQNITFSWSPPTEIDNVQSLQPIVTPAADKEYTLTVSSAACGDATDVVKVFVFKDIYVPTAFTPNNNGRNDTWNIPALNAFTNADVWVYNRWGQVVFQTKNTYIPWDGKYKGLPQPAGVYVYVIDLKLGGKPLKGTLMLIR